MMEVMNTQNQEAPKGQCNEMPTHWTRLGKSIDSINDLLCYIELNVLSRTTPIPATKMYDGKTNPSRVDGSSGISPSNTPPGMSRRSACPTSPKPKPPPLSTELDDELRAAIREKQYNVENQLGRGAFGVVYRGQYTVTGEDVAIKVIFLDQVTAKIKAHFLPRELAALMNLRHEFIITIRDIMTTAGKVFVFMEFANGGDIVGVIKKTKAALAEPLAAKWFIQITKAMVYLHADMHIAHRDIKLDNILLISPPRTDQSKIELLNAKLSDFGFATDSWDRESNKPRLAKTYCGTKRYFCPQLTGRAPYDPYAADCWAMGVALFVMLNNRFPYHCEDITRMLREMVCSSYLRSRYIRKDFPADLCDLLEHGLLVVDEALRLTMPKTLLHPWVRRMMPKK